jgi:protein CpxP
MSERSTPSSSSSSVSSTSSSSPRKWVWRAAAVAASATVALSLGAWAAGDPPRPTPASASAGTTPEHPPVGAHCEHGDRQGGHGHHGMGGGMGMGMGMGEGPGMMPFGGRQLGHMLDEVKATDAQRKQIEVITDKARTDVQALHEEGRKLHEQGLALWAAPKLDAAAIEAHRQQMLKHHDQVTQRMSQAMLEAGKVLSPEQRATLVQRMRDHHMGMMARIKAHLSH